MSSETTKEKLMEATMQLASEVGLFGFSMKQVTDRVGVSESLLFKYYETKENLLLQCFLAVNRMRSEAFPAIEMQGIRTREEAEALVRRIWGQYYEFLIRSDFRTIFYYEYRDSSYMMEYMRRNEGPKKQKDRDILDIIAGLDRYFRLRQPVSWDVLRVWFLDTTGSFAKRVIRGEIGHNEENEEMVWTLLWRGFLDLVV